MRIFAAFLIWPLVEIALFVLIGGQVGVWPVLIWVVLSALLGILVMRLTAARQALALRDGLRGLRDPARLAAAGILSMVAGVLLILPGFLTDAVGLVLLLPPVQALVARYAEARVTVIRPQPGEVIDGDYTEVEPRPGQPSGWTRIE
ncbi:FxsA family protein [Rhodobacter sp. SGA-6-6]|uniref:FxsA family protein n=1 Tax=Rhodobacter sp. SGA-6-6 TaxID=2710882 RepID=UPI0013EB5C1A|nr:FxsA family protein [Rhodobacter sp. SGA-6-6]NGM46923.1 FxsA family protein [Rhodobacter sp. SGA-6-6]